MTTKKPIQQTPETKQQQQLTVATPQLPATSEEALDRHLAEWGGRGGRLFAFNGSTGIHRTLDDNVEVPDGTEFVAFLHETQKGHIKFNVDGPPDVQMVRVDQNAEVPERDTLGDNDRTKWPLDFNGEKADPWKLQFAIPMQRHDAGGELYVLVSRGPVAMTSVENLLGRWRHHPKRKEGFIPVIRIKNSSYWNKKYKRNQPKPEYVFVTWVTKTGAPPPSPALPPQLQQQSLAEEMNDEIPDFGEASTSKAPKTGREPKLTSPV
jgi:hypothetical protein